MCDYITIWSCYSFIYWISY